MTKAACYPQLQSTGWVTDRVWVYIEEHQGAADIDRCSLTSRALQQRICANPGMMSWTRLFPDLSGGLAKSNSRPCGCGAGPRGRGANHGAHAALPFASPLECIIIAHTEVLWKCISTDVAGLQLPLPTLSSAESDRLLCQTMVWRMRTGPDRYCAHNG